MLHCLCVGMLPHFTISNASNCSKVGRYKLSCLIAEETTKGVDMITKAANEPLLLHT